MTDAEREAESLKRMIEIANEGGWTEAERATMMRVWERTEADYLAIVDAGMTHSLGEYDNLDVVFGMIKRGVLEIDTSKPLSKHTSMFTSIWVRRPAEKTVFSAADFTGGHFWGTKLP